MLEVLQGALHIMVMELGIKKAKGSWGFCSFENDSTEYILQVAGNDTGSVIEEEVIRLRRNKQE